MIPTQKSSSSPSSHTLSESAANKLRRLVADARARSSIVTDSAPSLSNLDTIVSSPDSTELNSLSNNSSLQGISRDGKLISYNEKQLQFMQIASTGESSILIGAAGTGKTTCMRGVIESLIQSGYAGLLNGDGHKFLPDSGAPGIVAISYTRRAVANLKRAMPNDMKSNCITIHKLLEYEPVYYTVLDETTGDEKSTMRFEPTRNQYRPLPSSIHTVIIDESSMVSTDLFKELENALPHKPQFIFLGDIQQLPPVFGAAILGYKMLELKTVELTEVYRQALESPIIRLAHRILSGIIIPPEEYIEWKFENKLTLHPWKKKLSADLGLATAAKFFTTAIDHGSYDWQEDQILIPYNKAFGTEELNKHIANHLARKRQAITYEIIAGFKKHYFSAGDKVLYDKEDAAILEIKENPAYSSNNYKPGSKTLDYWGYDSGGKKVEHHLSEEEIDEHLDFVLDQVAGSGNDEDRVRQASHIITLELYDSGKVVDVSTSADINTMLLGYALTIHKSQGSEWRKVFLVLHQSHAKMIQRELLYTAVTRAKEELYVICEPESFTGGILSQRIKGNTLAEKAEFFKGRLEK